MFREDFKEKFWRGFKEKGGGGWGGGGGLAALAARTVLPLPRYPV